MSASAAARERLGRLEALALVALLLAIVTVTLPELGSDPWRFRPGAVHPSGPLAPLVRAAGEEWDVGIARAAAFLAALLCGARRAHAAARPHLAALGGVALVLAVGVLLLVPSTLLQLGLRESTAPWFFTNDSTYQIELGGDLVLRRRQPLRARLPRSGLERFYTRDGSASERVREREVALEHFAYFPGSLITAAPRRLLPAPFDDYRLLVLLTTLAGLAAALAFPAPLGWRLAIGALLVCNPIASARRGSARTTRPACCCWCWRSRSWRGGGSAGPRRPWPARCCRSSSRSSRCRSSR